MVSSIILMIASALAQTVVTNVGHNTVCYTVEILVWALLGMIIGQIRKLSTLTYVTNFTVYLNIAVCILTMVGAATAVYPNYNLFLANYGDVWPYNVKDIIRKAIMPGNLYQRIGGMNNMVFAWGGAVLFCEVMAELRHPMDFWKGMLCAQILILVVYLFFGLFVYSYFGQFSYVTAFQSMTSKGLQTAANVMSIIIYMLDGLLYGNVGMKIIYQGALVPECGFPELTSRKGAIIWGGITIVFWVVVFVIAAALPSISTLVDIIGAFCTLNFSYTLPLIFMLCFMWRLDSSKDDIFDLATSSVTKRDSYSNWSRWKRAATNGGTKQSAVKLSLFLLSLASLACCGLCAYAAIEDGIEAWSGPISSFTCEAPV